MAGQPIYSGRARDDLKQNEVRPRVGELPNSPLLTDTFWSPLRASCGAAKRER